MAIQPLFARSRPEMVLPRMEPTSVCIGCISPLWGKDGVRRLLEEYAEAHVVDLWVGRRGTSDTSAVVRYQSEADAARAIRCLLHRVHPRLSARSSQPLVASYARKGRPSKARGSLGVPMPVAPRAVTHPAVPRVVAPPNSMTKRPTELAWSKAPVQFPFPHVHPDPARAEKGSAAFAELATLTESVAELAPLELDEVAAEPSESTDVQQNADSHAPLDIPIYQCAPPWRRRQRLRDDVRERQGAGSHANGWLKTKRNAASLQDVCIWQAIVPFECRQQACFTVFQCCRWQANH